MIVNKQQKKKKPPKYTGFLIITGIVFTTIVARLIYVQVYKHDDYKEKADTTSTKFVSETAPRGIIFDQNGNILASNTQTYAITYTITDEATKHFFKTMDTLMEILEEKDDTDSIQDNLILKIDENDNPYFEYTSTSESGKKSEELLFKRDRGMNEDLETKLRKKENMDASEDLTDKQIEKINDQLMEITADESFNYLVKLHNLIKLLNPTDEEMKKYKEMTGKELTDILLKSYTRKELREYMVVLDALRLKSLNGYESVTIAKNINKETAFIIYQKLNDLPGIDISLEPIRNYPYKELASSAIGYLSPISSSNKEKYELRGYDVSTDLIGVAGIESAFEEQLKGVKGGTTVKVNSTGRVTQELFKLESYPGNNVHLTLDKNLQYVAEQALNDTMEEIRNADSSYSNCNRGAVIVTEVNTGRILALVSLPNYDPNDFAISGQLSPEKTAEYFAPNLEAYGNKFISSRGLQKTVDDLFPLNSSGNREDQYDLYPKPFYNYATQGLIQPGSTFKIMTSVAGIESGAIDSTTQITCRHTFNEHTETFGSGFAPTCLGYHGTIGIGSAIEQSCNYYFYETGYRIYKNGGANLSSLDILAHYAWKFGLGVDPNGQQNPSTGIEIEENFGQVYNFKSWKTRAIASSKLYLAQYLESGEYNGTFFAPLDYSKNEDDEEDVKNAKADLKEKITNRFNQIGTDEQALGTDAFAKDILDDVKKLMNSSEKYKSNLKAYEESRNITTTIDKQAVVVANVIARFVVQDKGSEITSPAELINASIGQGMNAFTPLQLAQYVSTIATNGVRYKMHLVDKITNPDGGLIEEYTPEVLDKTELKQSTISAIRDGMSRVNEEGGTASTAFLGFPISTAGKTGTADLSDKQYEIGRAPYATYISYAPFDNPEISVVVVAYDGGHGGSVAKVTRAVYEAYFKDRLLQMDSNYASKSETFSKYVLTIPEDNKEEE